MKELTYKIATIEDYDDFYTIKCDPENIKWSGFATAPDYECMKEWFRQQLEGDKRTIYLCYWKGEVCGFFYLDKLSDDSSEETGYGVLTKFAGRGIGTAIVRFAKELCKSINLCAWVSEKNRASERCFEKNGFEKRDLNAMRTLASFNEDQRFFFWTIIVNKSYNQNADDERLSSIMGGGRIAPPVYAAFYNYAA